MRFFYTLAFLSFSIITQAQEIKTNLGSVKYKINSDNTITYLGTNIDQKWGGLSYKGDLAEKNKVHTLEFADDTFSVKFSKAFGQQNYTNYMLKFNNFSYTNQNGSEFYAYQDKNIKLDILNYDNKIQVKDKWGQNISTSQVINFKSKNLQIKALDGYHELTSDFGALKFKNYTSETQSENNISYKAKDFSLDASNFQNQKLEKTFINVKKDKMELKSVTDNDVSAHHLSFNKTQIAFNENQSYIQTDIEGLKIKAGFDGETPFGSFQYQNFAYDNEVFTYKVQVNKEFDFTISSENKINTLNYKTKIQDSSLSFKYTNQFDVFDFYFNQSIFSIYNNNFNLIGTNNSRFKESTAFSFVNPKFSANFDAINDIWNLSVKAGNNFTAGYLKDQRNNYLTLGNKNNLGTISMGYNILTQNIDRAQIMLTAKF